MNETSAQPSSIYLVGGSAATAKCISEVCADLKIDLGCFPAESDFLKLDELAEVSCVILVRSTGVEPVINVVGQMRERGLFGAVVVVADSFSLIEVTEVMRKGAVTVLDRSYTTEQLKSAIILALETQKVAAPLDRLHFSIGQRLAKLTERQRAVLGNVVDGLQTKEIAVLHGVSQRLIEMERSVLLREFDVESTPELTRMMGQFEVMETLRIRSNPMRRAVASLDGQCSKRPTVSAST